MTRLSILIVLSCALLAGTATAESMPEPRMMTLTSGIICDTPEQVETLLTGIHLTGDFIPVEGCGSINGIFPAVVQPLNWYETPSVRSLVASFTAPNGYVQYGWIAFEPITPELQPATVEQDA